MKQKFAVLSCIICMILMGQHISAVQSAQAETTAPRPAILNYRVMGVFELAKLSEAGDAGAIRELEKRYGARSTVETPKKAYDPNAPVLGTSKGLGAMPPKLKRATSNTSASKKSRSYADMKKELSELEAKVNTSMAKIKAGTYSAADKKETAATLKRLKEVQAEFKIKKLTDAVGQLKKRTKIVGENAKNINKRLSFVWTMKPAELKALAEKGDPEAQAELAHRYSDGKRGFKKDDTASFNWMLKASNGGNIHAQNFTASNYYYGEGTAKDNAKAAHWLKKSAENGNKFAQYQLHQEYDGHWGIGGWKVFPRNLAKANYWLDKASAQGFAVAIGHKKKSHSAE